MLHFGRVIIRQLFSVILGRRIPSGMFDFLIEITHWVVENVVVHFHLTLHCKILLFHFTRSLWHLLRLNFNFWWPIFWHFFLDFSLITHRIILLYPNKIYKFIIEYWRNPVFHRFAIFQKISINFHQKLFFNKKVQINFFLFETFDSYIFTKGILALLWLDFAIFEPFFIF